MIYPPPTPLGSAILDTGKTPAEWVTVLAERGLEMSERTLREKANRHAACYKAGRGMIITPEQIDTILMEGQKCRLKSIKEGAFGTQGGGSSSTANLSLNTPDTALAHLQKQARGNGAPRSKTGKSAVTSMVARKS